MVRRFAFLSIVLLFNGFSVASRAQDTNPPVISWPAIFNFEDPALFNNPIVTDTRDYALSAFQETTIADNGRGFSVYVLEKKCVPNPLAFPPNCVGIENRLGAKSVEILSIRPETKFKSIKMHLLIPTPIWNQITVFGLDITLKNPTLDEISTFGCSSSYGELTIIDAHTLEISLENVPSHEMDILIECNKAIKRVFYTARGSEPEATLRVGNPVLLAEMELSSEIKASKGGLLPSNSNNACKVKVHSFVNTDTLALQEIVPVVGVPFELNYSSDRFREGFGFSLKDLGLGGWSPSILHHYDVSNKILYLGDGGIRPVSAVSANGGYYLASQSGSEIYYFNSSGVHTETKDALTGLPKYFFNYDSSLRLSSILDRFSNTTIFQYSSGAATITSSYGQITNLSLSSSGFLSSVTNPNNETYTLTTNDAGLLLSFQKPGGQKSITTYDTNGYVTKDFGAGGDFINFIRQFDKTSKIQTVTSRTALGRQTKIEISTPDILSSTHVVTDSSGMRTGLANQDQGGSSSQDSLGNTLNTILASDPRFGWMAPYESSSRYQVLNSNIDISTKTQHTAELVNTADPLSVISLNTTTTLQNDPTRVFSLSFDATKKLFMSLSPLKRVTYQSLNIAGQVGETQVGGLTPVHFFYDSKGRLSLALQGDRKMTLTYDNHGNIASSTDFLGRNTGFEYDNAGRVTKKILPDGNTISMTHDANGNVTSITPPGRTAHSFSYNLFEMIEGYLPPALSSMISGAAIYQYNLDQQIIQIDRPDGSLVGMNYDPISGLLISLSTPQGNYSFSYAEKSNLPSSVTSPDNVVLNYQYAGTIPTVISISGPITSSLVYSYNSDGAVAGVSVAGKSGVANSVALSYDKDGLMVSAGNEVLIRDSVGAINATKLGKVSELITYDNYGQKVSTQFMNGKRGIFWEEFSRDKLGRIVGVKEISDNDRRDQSYEYDKQGRLMKVSFKKMPLRQYKYDANGNRVEALYRHHSVKALYDAQDRLVKYGENEYQYNANGDLTQKIENDKNRAFFWPWGRRDHEKENTKITTYTYDVFGNLKSVVLPNKKKIEYIVDGQNRRVGRRVNGKIVQGFVYQSQTQVAAEFDGDGNLVKRFVYSSKLNVPDYMIYKGKEYRIISNSVGTPRLVVDASTGKAVQKLDFDEFGVPREIEGESLIPFGFAGGLYDQDTRLVHFGRRDYDAETGRWTGKDPILFKGGSANLYGYVMNDPINLIDPSGLWSVSLNLFYGVGLGVTFGVNPDESAFGSVKAGVGIGAGASYDPHGQSSSYGQCSNKDVAIGQYAEASANIGAFEGSFSTSSGFGQSRGAYYNRPVLSGGITPSTGIGAGVSGGLEVSWH